MAPKKPADGLFKATTPQTPIDRTTEAARQIISDETHLRDANVKRLKELRLARDADQVAAIPEPKTAKAIRKKKP